MGGKAFAVVVAVVVVALALLTPFVLALAGAGPPPAPQSPPPSASPSPEPPGWREAAAGGPLSWAERQQRRRRFLDTALRQMHRLEQIEHPLDIQRLAAGALTPAALAAGATRAAGGAGPRRTAPAEHAARLA